MRATLDAATAPHLTDVVLRPAATAKVFLGAGQTHETIAVPGVALADDDVLIAVELSTICESDVQTVQGCRAAPVPLVLGHESVGRVVAIGADGVAAADGEPLRLGDRVVWSRQVTCGDCDRCRPGSAPRCAAGGEYGHERVAPHRELTGGFASHVQLRRGTTIVRVPESLPAAALAPASCATATAWAAVARAARLRELDGARVRVRGAGLLGLTAAAIAAEQGAVVEVVDPHPQHRAFAEAFGIAASDAAALERDPAPEVVIAASDRLAEALAEVDAGGVVVLIGDGLPADLEPVDAEALTHRMLTVIGVPEGTGDDLIAAVDFLAGRGRAYPFADAVGAVRQLADLDAALADAAAPDAPLRFGVVTR